ncbi:MAG: hypothetical protein M1834_008941 [Cirrosporium novae-zelandiae]|nr:MAG: hypothetical protein M1834_008941 [Cirrosporium novae-zelandiae]
MFTRILRCKNLTDTYGPLIYRLRSQGEYPLPHNFRNFEPPQWASRGVSLPSQYQVDESSGAWGSSEGWGIEEESGEQEGNGERRGNCFPEIVTQTSVSSNLSFNNQLPQLQPQPFGQPQFKQEKMLAPEPLTAFLTLNLSPTAPALFLFTKSGTLLAHAPSPLPPSTCPTLTIRTLRDIAALLGIASNPSASPSERSSVLADEANDGKNDIFTTTLKSASPSSSSVVSFAVAPLKSDRKLLLGALGAISSSTAPSIVTRHEGEDLGMQNVGYSDSHEGEATNTFASPLDEKTKAKLREKISALAQHLREQMKGLNIPDDFY